METNYKVTKDLQNRSKANALRGYEAAELKKEKILAEIMEYKTKENPETLTSIKLKNNIGHKTFYRALDRWGVDKNEVSEIIKQKNADYRFKEINALVLSHKTEVLERLKAVYPDTFESICSDIKISKSVVRRALVLAGVNMDVLLKTSRSRRLKHKGFSKINIQSILVELSKKNPKTFTEICAEIGVNQCSVYEKAERQGLFKVLSMAVSECRKTRTGSKKSSVDIISKKWV